MRRERDRDRPRDSDPSSSDGCVSAALGRAGGRTLAGRAADAEGVPAMALAGWISSWVAGDLFTFDREDGT